MAQSSRLAAHRARTPEIQAGSTPDNDETLPEGEVDETSEGEEEKEEYMTEEEHKAALERAQTEAKAEGETAGFEAANKRVADVMASEHYAGNQSLAASLLGKKALNAVDIIEALEAAGPSRTTASEEDDDGTSAREEMREKLAASQPGPTGDEGSNDELEAEDNSLVDSMKARFGEAK